MEVIERYYVVRRVADGAFYSKKRNKVWYESEGTSEDMFSFARKPRVFNRKGDAGAIITSFAKGNFLHWVTQNEPPTSSWSYTHRDGTVSERHSYRMAWTEEEAVQFKAAYRVEEVIAVILSEGETVGTA